MLSRFRKHLNHTVGVTLRGQRFRIPVWGGIEVPGIRDTQKTAIIERFAQGRAGVFVDVGVNLGQTLLDMRATHPHLTYIGFEPNPACVSYVRQLIAHNGWQRCTIVPTALSSEVGLLKLFSSPNVITDHGSTLIANLRPQQSEAAEQWVPVFRFDDIAQEIGAEQIAFVKIDVEGAELDVLSGMANSLGRSRPPVLCEVLPRAGGTSPEQTEARKAALLELMVDRLGYRLYHVQAGAEGQIEAVSSFQPGPYDRARSWDYLFINGAV